MNDVKETKVDDEVSNVTAKIKEAVECLDYPRFEGI